MHNLIAFEREYRILLLTQLDKLNYFSPSSARPFDPKDFLVLSFGNADFAVGHRFKRLFVLLLRCVEKI